mgnify:CR=1 FL=1
MINFVLISIICFCILILVAENSNPDGMKIIYKYIWKKLKNIGKLYENGNQVINYGNEKKNNNKKSN